MFSVQAAWLLTYSAMQSVPTAESGQYMPRRNKTERPKVGRRAHSPPVSFPRTDATGKWACHQRRTSGSRLTSWNDSCGPESVPTRSSASMQGARRTRDQTQATFTSSQQSTTSPRVMGHWSSPPRDGASILGLRPRVNGSKMCVRDATLLRAAETPARSRGVAADLSATRHHCPSSARSVPVSSPGI